MKRNWEFPGRYSLRAATFNSRDRHRGGAIRDGRIAELIVAVLVFSLSIWLLSTRFFNSKIRIAISRWGPAQCAKRYRGFESHSLRHQVRLCGAPREEPLELRNIPRCFGEFARAPTSIGHRRLP
jgi:hypothetical protein